MGYFWGWGRVNKLFVWSTYVVEQLLFSIVPSIMTFDFGYFFLVFGALMGYFWGRGRAQKLFLGVLI